MFTDKATCVCYLSDASSNVSPECIARGHLMIRNVTFSKIKIYLGWNIALGLSYTIQTYYISCP